MKKYLLRIFESAAADLSYLKDVNVNFEQPKEVANGDLATNCAMLLSKLLKKNPRAIAEEILAALKYDADVIEKIEIAGAGFINFYFTPKYVNQIIAEINRDGKNFGKSDLHKNKVANVEFVSANPTGPLTVGHGRNAVCGDTIANLLEWIGYSVDREYYFNNAGRQMRTLGDSVRLRYLQLLNQQSEFPDDYYQGEYIKEIAQKIADELGDKLVDESAEGIFKEKAESEIFADIKNTLTRLGIEHKIFFNENSLYEEKKIEELLKIFEQKKLSYKKDGAVWLSLSDLGNENDKVIVKSTGEPTYRLPDIAYHITKFERHYDLIVDLFGSDHNATYPDVIAALKVLNHDTKKIKVLIHQFVTVTQGKEVVKMSTRKANFITLDELIDEVGGDVVRYFFNMRNINTHMNFDLELAKKHSDENPVFYMQYAHARICSILRMTAEKGIFAAEESLDLLSADEEQQLVKSLHKFPSEVLVSAENFEPNRICTYLENVAGKFHRFYTECRIIGSEEKLASARVALCVATKNVIANGLSILGVTAPERM